MRLLLFLSLQETPARTEKGAGAQKTAHQEAAKRLHALHERDARERGRRVHTEGERRHQSNPGPTGRCSDLLLFVDMSRTTERSQFKEGRNAWTVIPGPISSKVPGTFCYELRVIIVIMTAPANDFPLSSADTGRLSN